MIEPSTDVKHEFFRSEYSFGSWIECTCGFRPESEQEFNFHVSYWENRS